MKTVAIGEADDAATRAVSSVGRKRLLFVVNDTSFFVSHRLPLALAARAHGFEIHLAALETGGRDVIEGSGITFHPLHIDRAGLNPMRELRSIWQMGRVLADVDPVLLHGVTIKPVVYGGIVARVLGVPAVVHAVTGLGWVFGDEGARNWAIRRIVALLYAFALNHRNGRAIFQNPDDLELMVTGGLIRSDRATLIRGSGVDLSAFRPTPEPDGEPVVVLPARLLWEKGVRQFVEAGRLVRAAGVSARFALVGEPPAHNRNAVPRGVIEDWVRDGDVEWWGHQADMSAVYARSHVVCLPTFYREGVPKALLEAAACGRPIVTTDAPGCREVVRHRDNGLLVPPRSVQELAAALKGLLANPKHRLEMGRRGRMRVEEAELSVERVTTATLRVYGELCAGAAADGRRRTWRSSSVGLLDGRGPSDLVDGKEGSRPRIATSKNRTAGAAASATAVSKES